MNAIQCAGLIYRDRRVTVIVLSMILSLPGCAAAEGAGRRRAATASASAPVDAKAVATLDQVEPPVTTPAAPDAVSPLSERAAQRLAKARELVAQQRFTEASIELERAMRYDPNHPQIHAALAVLHWQARNIERAKDHAQRAIAADPTMTAPHYVLGRCSLEREDHAAASAALRTALRCSDFGNDAELEALTHYYLATLLKDEGYISAALQQFEAFEAATVDLPAPPGGSELRPLVPNTSARLAVTKSELYECLGRYADAADALRPVVEGETEDSDTAIHYARLLLKAGREDDALAAARSIDDDKIEVVELVFQIQSARGTPEATLDDLNDRIARRPDSATLSAARAWTLGKLGREDEALRVLEQHVHRFEQDQEARETLVELLINNGRWADALDVCAATLTEDVDQLPGCGDRVVSRAATSTPPVDVGRPTDSALSDVGFANAYLRARIAGAGGDGEAALVWLERSYQVQPKFSPTRIALGKAYIDRFRYADAIGVAGRVDEAAPQNAELERLLGTAYDRLDDLPRAEVHLRAATQLDRGDTESMFLLAKVYRRQGKSNLAQRQLRVLLSTVPDHEGSRELLALLYMRERKGQEAFDQIDTLKRLSKKPTTIARCETLLDADLRADPEKLRQHLRDAMDMGEPDAPTWIAIAESYSRFEPEARRKAYRRALDLEPNNEEAAAALVDAMQLDLDFESAVEQLRAMLRRRPNRNAWHSELVDVLTTLLRYDEAVAHVEERLGAADLDVEVRRDFRVRLLNTLRVAHRSDELIERLSVWAKADHDDPQWRRWLADEYVRIEQAALAVPIREALFEEAPEDWSGLGGLVAALAAAERHDRAMQYVLDRLSIDPESDNAGWMLASILADADRLDEGLELVNTRLRDTFQREIFQDFLLSQLQVADRFDEAIEYVEALHDEAFVLLVAAGEGRRPRGADRGSLRRRTLQPDEPQTPQGLQARVQALRERWALVLIDAERFAEARQRLNEWLDDVIDPRVKLVLQRLLAFCYRSEGNEPRANELMEQALQTRPEDVLLNNDVAYAWIDQGIRLDEAERMIRFALGERPRQGAYLDTYGWLLYKKGEFDVAIKWLDRSRSSPTGDDPVVHDHLGDAYWRMGNKAKAVELWQKAAELVADREVEDLASADERRVKETVRGKIEAARAGEEPAVAPLQQPVAPSAVTNDES